LSSLAKESSEAAAVAAAVGAEVAAVEAEEAAAAAAAVVATEAAATEERAQERLCAVVAMMTKHTKSHSAPQQCAWSSARMYGAVWRAAGGSTRQLFTSTCAVLATKIHSNHPSVPQKVLTSSRKVDECMPLACGGSGAAQHATHADCRRRVRLGGQDLECGGGGRRYKS
jgi:hypothetical protein